MLFTVPYNYFEEEPCRLSNLLITMNEKFENNLELSDLKILHATLHDIYKKIIEIQIAIEKLKVNQVHSDEDIADYQRRLDNTIKEFIATEKRLITARNKFLSFAKANIVSSTQDSISFTDKDELLK